MLVHATAANKFGFVGGANNVNNEFVVLQSTDHLSWESSHLRCYKCQFLGLNKLELYY